jgi:hypothetical protein
MVMSSCYLIGGLMQPSVWRTGIGLALNGVGKRRYVVYRRVARVPVVVNMTIALVRERPASNAFWRSGSTAG